MTLKDGVEISLLSFELCWQLFSVAPHYSNKCCRLGLQSLGKLEACEEVVGGNVETKPEEGLHQFRDDMLSRLNTVSLIIKILPQIGLNIDNIGLGNIGEHPKLDPKLSWLGRHELSIWTAGLAWEQLLINCEVRGWVVIGCAV